LLKNASLNDSFTLTILEPSQTCPTGKHCCVARERDCFEKKKIGSNVRYEKAKFAPATNFVPACERKGGRRVHCQWDMLPRLPGPSDPKMIQEKDCFDKKSH